MFKTEYVDNFAEFFADYKEHIEKHYYDFAETFDGDRKLDIDVQLFQQLIDLGHANIFTLWEDETFIGYVSVSISPSVLFKGKIDAIIDHFYITEEARGSGYAKKIIEELEEQFKEDGLDRYTLAFPAIQSYEKLAESFGFTKQSSVYIKSLGE
tara:strand:- start:847 stop:1308 length:462 start_codon:yes stop_codon:yes gene_type:complete